MATLVFSAMGTLVAGPVGGALGSMVGSQVDDTLFGSSNQQGARLKELDTTTSSYGRPVPRHFGRMRGAGQLIWAAPLTETSEVLGGGKGAVTFTTYSYSASFAVALSSRPIRAIGRIWADGRLLRGAAGDLKTGGNLRIHLGNGDQECDPLILAAEGPAMSPAHRDLAYVVFEDLDLSDFYNRIPSLTFEVIADDDFDLSDLFVGDIDDSKVDIPLAPLSGLSCEGSLSDTLSLVDRIIPLDIDCAGEKLVISRGDASEDVIAMPEAASAMRNDGMASATGFVRQRAPIATQPLSALRYLDLARDYQPGIQYASGPRAGGDPLVLELPAALHAQDAKVIVERLNRQTDWRRETIGWRSAELDPRITPGALVSMADVAGIWRVRAWELNENGTEIEAERALPLNGTVQFAGTADAGRGYVQPDRPVARSHVAAYEMPYDPAIGNPGSARILVAASSAQSNWPGAALYADRGDGALHPLGPSGRRRSIVGWTLNAIGCANPLRFDRTSQLVVELIDPAMQLASINGRQLGEGANLALVGEEMVQFSTAERIDGTLWKLSGLVRACHGTDATVSTHIAGEGFALIDGQAVPIDSSLIGTAAERRIAAIGRADSEPVSTHIATTGLTLRPLAPVHPRCHIQSDGGWQLQWTRRARGIHPWRDGIDMPLVEETESYLLTFGPYAAPLAAWSLSTPSFGLSTALREELMALAPNEWLRVAQQGTYSLSMPLDICTLN